MIEKYNQQVTLKIELNENYFFVHRKNMMYYNDISIYLNDNYSYTNISTEIYEIEEEKLKVKFNTFIKVILPDIKEYELENIWRELKKGNYDSYEKYTYRELRMRFSMSPLINSDKKILDRD